MFVSDTCGAVFTSDLRFPLHHRCLLNVYDFVAGLVVLLPFLKPKNGIINMVDNS